ncbi:MAG: AI-2E family transporter [Rickettsiales bacterium]|jgi:predicted PurR-regulated permease PerM|nr:AI-2E family transporter [Rickettsiales bacterium]
MSKILYFIGTVLIVFILWIGRPLLLPIITAAFFWYLINAIAEYYRQVVRSEIASKLLAVASLAGILYMFVALIQPMLVQLYGKMPEISAGVEKMLADASEFLGIEMSFSDLPSFQEMVSVIGSSIASVGAAFGMIMIYMIFIFIEQNTFPKKLRALFPVKKQFTKASFILNSIDAHMKKYIFVKTGISLATAVCIYAGLVQLGVEFAGVWAFFTFILNYIPTFGSIASTVLPMIYVFAMSGDIRVPIIIAIESVVVNLIFGNILDPKLTGKSLNLSALAILINLVFWGMLWGSIGMFFSVPILVMIYVVAAQFDRTRPFAILLSADGDIPDKNDTE